MDRVDDNKKNVFLDSKRTVSKKHIMYDVKVLEVALDRMTTKRITS